MSLDHVAVGEYWNKNAAAWTELSRAGHDICRDGFNTPSFLGILPDVTGLRGLDIGCGEGHNTRQVADRGARMTAVDIASVFVQHAQEAEQKQPRGIRYARASAVDLPFAEAEFDFCTSFMCLMDLPEQDQALAEAYRVLKPGGFLQFSITHPCFHTPLFNWVHDDDGQRIGLTVGRYWDEQPGEVETWTFSSAPTELAAKHAPFEVPRFERTLSEWLNALADTGFRLEQTCEPRPDEATLARFPRLIGCRNVPLFLILRGRKPS